MTNSDTEGYYIHYEDTDSRVMPYCAEGDGRPGREPSPAPFATELEATQALLTYFKELQAELVICIKETEKALEQLRPIPSTCVFIQAWIGQCKNAVVAGEKVCQEHLSQKCSCGEQAVENCYHTIGAFVCGRLTCGRCTHSH